jgi:hypothetical protein
MARAVTQVTIQPDLLATFEKIAYPADIIDCQGSQQDYQEKEIGSSLDAQIIEKRQKEAAKLSDPFEDLHYPVGWVRWIVFASLFR